MVTKNTSAEVEVHLLSIRTALKSRNAAVMVGAGFSRNAEGGDNLATWSDLSKALAAELEPDRDSNHFSPASASQLAEQYARVFSSNHLEQLIKRSIPDDQVTPGPLHKALVSLPWSEVFTTNYDTLLERATDQLFDVSYFTVCSREDIPQSKLLGRRRIVKLHGSFPSHRPFILTEEDYRTYPDKFAPFVNLVRQSLLENVFCLIGFSGDDPNFLRWLGWVRDMLNQHALPVYLFLAKEPTLGERKLYEARGVTAVLLPTPEGAAADDYRARYRALFAELKKPLADLPQDWGDWKQGRGSIDDTHPDKAYLDFLDRLIALQAYRATYPDWIVAPRPVRARFRHSSSWLESALLSKWLRELLVVQPPAVNVAIIELYCWVQHVQLGPLLDEVVSIGVAALESRPAFTTLNGDALRLLERLNIHNDATLERRQTSLVASLLSWARQSHRTTEYKAFKDKLSLVAQRTGEIHDRLNYEEALWCLQQADQASARAVLSGWQPKGSDAYMYVLKGVLTAEVTDAASALPILEHGIQILRRQHRARPGDPELMSKESWALFVARNIQNAKNPPWAPKKSDAEDDDNGSADFDDRLKALSAIGYSARDELNACAADLNAEALDPTHAVLRTAGFDVGSVSTNHVISDLSIEIQKKLQASFSWLDLTERVGLPLHTKNANFYSDQMLQAAWWARFADTRERSIGLLLRTMRASAIRPRDSKQPPHQTGWLSRREVAVFRADVATDLASELLKQVMSELTGAGQRQRSRDKLLFLLEAFSRLVIRVTDDELLRDFGQTLLKLYSSPPFQADSSFWSPASTALARVFEALPESSHPELLLKVFGVPLTSISLQDENRPEHELAAWLSIDEIAKHCVPAQGRPANGWVEVTEDLVRQLRSGLPKAQVALVWRRLDVLRNLRLLSAEARLSAEQCLWSSATEGVWPKIPGQPSGYTLVWCSNEKHAANNLLTELVKHKLRPFSSGYMQMQLAGGGRSYSIGGVDAAMRSLRSALARSNPSTATLSAFLDMVSEWMDNDLKDLARDQGDKHLADSCEQIVDYLDHMFARCIELLAKRRTSRAVEVVVDRVVELDAKLDTLEIERFEVKRALIKACRAPGTAPMHLARSVMKSMRSDGTATSLRAFRTTYRLLQDEGANLSEAAKAAFVAAVACAYSQHEACLPRAMNVLSHLSPVTWRRFLDNTSLTMLDALLEDLRGRLRYDLDTRQTSESAQEHLPHLRFGAFQLASALIETAQAESPAARKWLDDASNDPLPEIRYQRFRAVSRELSRVQR